MQGEDYPPTIATYWPISVPLRSWHSILHWAGTSSLSTARFSFLMLTPRHKYSCTISLYLPLTCQELNVNKRLHLWWEEGQQKYVHMSWTWETHWLLLINNGTSLRPKPLALCLSSFPFHTSKLCVCTAVYVRAHWRMHICVCACQSLWGTACGGVGFYLIRSGAASTTIRNFSPINVLPLIPLSAGDAASSGLLIHLKCKKYHKVYFTCIVAKLEQRVHLDLRHLECAV